MAIHLKAPKNRKGFKNRGFSLIEQGIALLLITIGSLCALEAIASCLECIMMTGNEWEKGMAEWNRWQLEQEVSINSEEEELGLDRPDNDGRSPTGGNHGSN